MQKFLLIFFVLLLSSNATFAYELILPKDKKTICNSQYAFFVGNAKKNEEILINDEKIPTASNGAFAHSVKLKNGENRIYIKSNYSRQIYKIYKEKSSNNVKTTETSFARTAYKVKNDNTPLRSTPVDYGMNRISHLFKDTNLIINGEKGDFYRVYLSKNKEAWISKNSVEVSPLLGELPKFITLNSKTFKNASVHTMEFTEKLPYTIDESDSEIVFKVYNPFIEEEAVYTVNIKKPKEYYYKTVLSNGNYQFKVNALPIPDEANLEGLTIAIDAGHGGSELGAIGCLKDKEKDINLKIAQELQKILTIMGANVIMTRECDANVDLNDRIKIAQDASTNIFVSIHLNSIGDVPMNIQKNRGTSVYYYNKNSKNLANILEESVTKGLGTKKDGVRTASFAVIRPTDYIGVLLEIAYMTNPLDSVLYRMEDFPEKTAKSIADGILKYTVQQLKCSK